MRDTPHHTDNREALAAFAEWCRANRHVLGRDRLMPAFVAGWNAGFNAAGHTVEPAGGAPTEDHDR